MKKYLLHIIVLSILATGCGTPRWTMIENPYIVEKDGIEFKAEVPEGWRQRNYSVTESKVVLTKEGTAIHKVVIHKYEIKEGLPYTKKILSEDMLPGEIAEILVKEIKGNKDLDDLKILNVKPIKIDGSNAFRIKYEYKCCGGLWKKAEYYGFVTEKDLYIIFYSGIKRHYFAKHHKGFQKILKSFTRDIK